MKDNTITQTSSYLEKVLQEKYFRKKKHAQGSSFKKTVCQLMSYTDSVDLTLMIVGMMAAIMSGLLTPISGVVFGSMSTAFVDQVKSTYSNDSSTLAASNDEFMSQILEQCSIMMYLAAVSLVINFIMPYTWDRVNIKQAYKIREVFFAQAMRQEAAWYEQKPDDVNLTTRLTDDVEKFKIGFGSKIPTVVQAFVTFAAGFMVGFFENWKLTLLALVGSPIVLGSSISHMLIVVTSMKREQSRYSEASTIATRTLSSFQVVSSLGNRIGEMLNFNKAVKDGVRAYRGTITSSGIAGSLSYAIVYLMYAAIIWYGGILMTTGEVNSKELFSVIRCVIMGALGVGNSIATLTIISEAMGSSANLLETIDNLPLVDPYSRDGLTGTIEGSVELKDIYFTYPTRKNIMVLCGLNLSVPKGKVVAIVGSSGSGKSTIINLILRFYDPVSGTVTIDGMDVKKMNVNALRSNIGVVSQEPVLFNVSVEENIRYGRTDATLEEIETAAKLAYCHDFIKLLPKGYQTLLGERGTKISGGQKQRIAIARALVRNPKILLLDEATSALDAPSEAIVQASLENAMRGRTTVIVAHRLSTVKNADVIHVMSGGKIIESGKHEDLLETKGAYYELVHRQQILEDGGERNGNSVSPNNFKEEEFITAPSPKKANPDKSTGSFPVKKLIVLCRPWLTVIGLIASLISALATPIFSYLFGQVVVASALPLGQLQAAFNVLSIYFVILAVGNGISKAISIVLLSVGTESVIGKLRTLMFHSILSQEYEFLEEDESSPMALGNKLARDPPKLKAIAGQRFGMTIAFAMAAVITIIAAFVSFWEVAILVTATVPIVTYAGYKQFRLSSLSYAQEHKASLLSTKLASECFENIKTIQFLGLQEYVVKNFAHSLEIEKQNEIRSAFFFALTFSIVSSCQFFAMGASYLLGAKLITLGIGSTGSLYMAVTGVTTSMTTAANCLAFFQDAAKSKASLASVLEIIYMKKQLDPYDMSGKKPEIKGRIQFSDVWFSYKTKENRPVLKGLNLDIEPGQTVALVGQSGCGKSTVINMIERFYTPTKGKITIDGVDIKDINIDYLRKHIGLVTQEPTLFNSSIKDNIVYGSQFLDMPITDEDVVKATKDANIHDFITSLPQGYDTKVGGRGCLLSGGQKQRLAIARALVRNPTLLLLDEATSALDAESEKVVQEAIENAQKGRTSVVVAHRLSTIKNADLIVVLEGGEVAEMGTHDELVELRGKYYSQLTQQ